MINEDLENRSYIVVNASDVYLFVCSDASMRYVTNISVTFESRATVFVLASAKGFT